MKKRMLEKGLLLFLAVCMMLPTVIFVSAEEIEGEQPDSKIAIFDDFEDYEDATEWATISKSETKPNIAANWIFAEADGGPLNTNPKARINDENGNKALQMTGITTYFDQYINRLSVARYNGDYSKVADTCKISFDVDKDSANSGVGIRFMIDPENSLKFYTLWLVGGKDNRNHIWEFQKVDGSKKATVNAKETFTGATTASGGAITSAHVEIVINGNEFSWKMSGNKYQNKPFESSGAYIDDSYTFGKPSERYIGFTVTNDVANIRIDNFKVENVEKYVDFEPLNVVYEDVSARSFENVIENRPVRRIVNVPYMNATVPVVLETVNNGEITVDAEFDDDGVWVNSAYTGDVTKVTLPEGDDCEGLQILTETEAPYEAMVAAGEEKEVFYPCIMGSMNSEEFTWTSANEKIATVENGCVKGIRGGEAEISAEYEGIKYTFKVRIKGEIDVATENGKIDEYIASKKPVFDAFNEAIKNDDTAAMEAMINGTSDIAKISDITDLEFDEIAQLDTDALALVCEKLKSYESFPCVTIEDIYALEAAMKKEYKACSFDGITDAEQMKQLVGDNAELFGINVENTFAKRYFDGAVDALIDKTFESSKQIKAVFDNAFVIAAYKDTAGYAVVGELFKACADEIGYDKDKFAENTTTEDGEETSEMYKYFNEADRKSTLETIEKLKTAIDAYEKPEEDEEDEEDEESSGGGWGGSGGGGGSYSRPSSVIITASPEIVKDANVAPVADSSPLYGDVAEDAWYFEYVKHLTGMKITGGYEDGNFYPENKITRAEFVKMLVGACGITAEEAEETTEEAAEATTEEAAEATTEEVVFADVAEDAWYAEVVKLAKDNGIVTGDENGNFNPDAYITRQELAVMLYRGSALMEKTLPNASAAEDFADINEIHDWAYGAVIKLRNAGFISGYADGSFRPFANATRGEVAKLISMLIKAN